jgi:DNA transformation protein
MAVTPEYREWVMEQLRLAGNVTGRSMFGGYSLYLDGAIFALIAEDVLYFKVDDGNRGEYEAAGTGPFRPFGDEHAMQYYEVPADVLEDPDRMRSWAERSAAISRKKARRKR